MGDVVAALNGFPSGLTCIPFFRYDRLVLLFTPEGILSGAAFEKSSDHPYWKAMTSDS
jgi:hypothetical protein